MPSSDVVNHLYHEIEDAQKVHAVVAAEDVEVEVEDDAEVLVAEALEVVKVHGGNAGEAEVAEVCHEIVDAVVENAEVEDVGEVAGHAPRERGAHDVVDAVDDELEEVAAQNTESSDKVESVIVAGDA